MVTKILIAKLSLCLCLLTQSIVAMNKCSKVLFFNQLAPFSVKQITKPWERNLIYSARKLSPELYHPKFFSRSLVSFISNEKNGSTHSTTTKILLPIILGTGIGTLALNKKCYADQDEEYPSLASKLRNEKLEHIIDSCAISSSLIRPSIIRWFLTRQKNHPRDYSINLMWINRQVATDQTYIYPSNRENNFGKQFLDTILMWAKKNPESTVNVWFDSYLTTNKAIANTQACINQEIKKYSERIASIELKDIRTLTRVKKNPEVFTPEIPIYFRTDLLRALMAEEITRQNKDLHFVYTDFDAQPMTKAHLFDKKTLECLDKYGFVMAYRPNTLRFENSFQIFTYNKKLSKALKIMVIKANILRAQSFLEDIQEKSNPGNIFNNTSVWKIHEIGFHENVYYSYPLMYAYFCQLENLSALRLPSSNKPYDKKNDGKEVLNINAKMLMARSSAVHHLSRFPMPTKRVSLPSSSSAYNELSTK